MSTGDPQEIGQGLLDGEDAQAPPPGSGEGSFVLTLVDHNGNPAPEGIPVQVRGPASLDPTTDGTGRATVTAPAGNYTYKVAATCTDSLHIRTGGTGTFRVVAGESASTQTDVTWVRKYGPWQPVYASRANTWAVGDRVRLRFNVVDRCAAGPRAPNADLSPYGYETAANVELVGDTVMRSDEDGYGYVSVRCTSAGPTSLVLVDRENPPDRLDLVKEEASSDRPPVCGG